MYIDKKLQKEIRKTQDWIFSKYELKLSKYKIKLDNGEITEEEYRRKREEFETKKLAEMDNAEMITRNKNIHPERWE